MSTGLDTKRVSAKALARHTAHELLPLLELPDNYGADYAEAFLDEMRKMLPKRREQEPPKPVPFARLAATTIPFGAYNGTTFGDIDKHDPSYLDWLCGVQESFLAELRAYMKHPDRRK